MRKLTLLASSIALLATACTASAAEIALAPFHKTVVAKEPLDNGCPANGSGDGGDGCSRGRGSCMVIAGVREDR